jgi:DNA repair exonuclease SbcCD nuclease subunit
MRIAAIGDAHLGRSYYPFTTDGGVNQREFDFEQSFEAAMDLAFAQEPDLIVWLGDIFDHPRPSYRSFRLAQSALAKVREHGIRAAVITGNHDTPRLPGKGSPYSALADTFPEKHFAHRLASASICPASSSTPYPRRSRWKRPRRRSPRPRPSGGRASRTFC